jgi:D-alanyl-D-alanine carboxypeptidase
MLKWAFSNIKMKVLADSSYNVGEIDVKYGRGADYVALVPKDDITAIVHEDLDIEAVTIEYAADFPEKTKAPVKQGEEIGKATVVYKGVKIADVVLVAQQDVKKNHLWAMFSWLEKLMSSKIFIVIVILIVIAIVVLLLSTQKQRKRKKRLKNKIDIVSDYSKLSK